MLREKVKAQTQMIWKPNSKRSKSKSLDERSKKKDIREYVYTSNILDIKPNIHTVLIGTVYKEMSKKPCILSNLVGVITYEKNITTYCTDEDQLVLEDSSGRVKIKKTPNG